MGIPRKGCKTHLPTMQIPLGLSMKRDIAFLRAAFAKPCANQLFPGYFWCPLLRLCQNPINFTPQRYHLCFTIMIQIKKQQQSGTKPLKHQKNINHS